MDHHSRRGVAGNQALPWLPLLLMAGMLSQGDCEQSDIDCLRSIKESLRDPLNRLTSWQFNKSVVSSTFMVCSFPGVGCWRENEAKILSIKLSGMGLRGEFPQGIAHCSSLINLDLSNNQLYGSIPSDISKLIPYVTYLDLSSNTFSGEIPPDIANFSYLNVLKLNNNLLTGHIPAELVTMKRLSTFTVANNLLSGPVPKFPRSIFPLEIYANNSGLCGDPLDPCPKNVFIYGFLVGWSLFSALFSGVGLFTPLWKLIINFMEGKVMETPRHKSLPSRQRINSMVSMLEKFATRMSFLELSEATDNFSENNVIAIGEMGITYKAILSNGFDLAVKRLPTAPHIEHEFRSEIMTLGRLRHGNLVPLIGFCHESGGRFLIYKFMPNGTLHDCLFTPIGKAKTLEWPVRVRIAVGIAKGVAWLHLNGVVHCGISSKCILLDENYNPKISDFRRATTLSGEVSVLCSYEEDVYGFGTVLLEMITGKRHEELINSFDIDGDRIQQISDLLKEPEAVGVFVESMIEEGFYDEMSHFLRIAGKCMERDPGNWPSMEEVHQMLIGTRRHDHVIDD